MPNPFPGSLAFNSPLRAWMLASWVLIAATPAVAFDFIVTRYDDPVPDGCLVADCSIREAVIAANVDLAADRVWLSAGVYQVNLAGSFEDNAATGDIDLVQNVEIVGAGATMTFIDGTGLGETPIATAGNLGLVTAIRNLTVQNSASSGLLLSTGTHTVEDCGFRDNGFGSTGPGIATTVQSVVTILRTTVVGSAGVGLSVAQGSATVENSTFSGNGNQEIVLNFAAAFSCTHCTVLASDADPVLTVIGATASLANSIFAGACSAVSGGAINSLGGNVESTGHTCGFTQGSDQDDVTAGALALGALDDNGGPTRTHLPGAASAANGSANDALCFVDDQRGVVRETNCESGAVERTNVAVATPIFHDGFLQGDSEAWSARVE
ncbi:MAG: right-handed parallel beta-helix repeat-containing protein [Thermoanaerobaculia bacterium]|nr:right-handed parallel beta-helix repeat-containing protein [Thermoanaerobaculia bacterium]MBP9824690.1 right-handed parallel beta-helix repeat-containing protein [Thermoanaerobaculia bacterium]